MGTKFRLILIFFFISIVGVYAQDSVGKSSPLSFSVDLMSRYVWRGTDIGQSPSIQPCFEYSPGNFTMGIWGAYSVFPADMQEIDLYISYHPSQHFSFMITDYLNTYYSAGKNHIFDFCNSTTPHLMEATAQLEPFNKIPLLFNLSTMFYGPDKILKNPADSHSFHQAYSTYLEALFEKEFNDFSFEFFAGLTPFKGLYADRFAVVNVGFTILKNIKVSTSFDLPVLGRLIINPFDKNIYFVAGFKF